MRAVVLVGGEGTRLRPLTETIPKPLLPVLNRSLLHRVLDHLALHGVHEVILSSPYLETAFRPFIAERRGDPAITWITEGTPLGTGGAIVNALDRVDGTFLVLNGDILTDLDLGALVEHHRRAGAAATITLTPVVDARPFGLVATDADGRVLEFREKPTEPIPGDVNAGTYVLEPRALEGWQRGAVISVEREIFPALIERGDPVHGFVSRAYWMDLGTPEKYLQAHFDLLEGRMREVAVAAPLVADPAGVDLRAHLGRWVVLAEGVGVGEETRIDDSVVMAGSTIGAGARVVGTIIGPGCTLGDGATVRDSVLGEGVTVPPGAVVEGDRLSARDASPA
jgi:mannose-1-phosphate guanylyltransferase